MTLKQLRETAEKNEKENCGPGPEVSEGRKVLVVGG